MNDASELRRRLTRDATLHHVDPHLFFRKLLEQAVLFTIGALLAAVSGAWPAHLLGLLIVGVVFARNLGLMHECLHGTALRGRLANRLAGTMLGLPMLVSFTEWRAVHAQHHRDVRTEGFQYRLERLRDWRELVLHLIMARHFGVALATIIESIARAPRRVDASLARSIRGEHLLMFAMLLLMLERAFRGTSLPLELWAFSLPIAILVHVHIELPEHLDCATETRDALQNARIVRAGRFAAWLTNNNHLHAAHHWLASVPIANLPHLTSSIEPHAMYVEESYLAFYRRFYTRQPALVSVGASRCRPMSIITKKTIVTSNTIVAPLAACNPYDA